MARVVAVGVVLLSPAAVGCGGRNAQPEAVAAGNTGPAAQAEAAKHWRAARKLRTAAESLPLPRRADHGEGLDPFFAWARERRRITRLADEALTLPSSLCPSSTARPSGSSFRTRSKGPSGCRARCSCWLFYGGSTSCRNPSGSKPART